MFVSVVSLAASVALMILFAARRSGGDGVEMVIAHMGIAAISAIGFAVAFFKVNDDLRASGARPAAVAASTARFVSYVLTWGAICLLTVYSTGILQWREWLPFTIGCLVLAGLSLVLASMLQGDADAGRDNSAFLKLAHWAAIATLAGMVVAILGLLIDGKMTRFLTPRFTDWAANNVFFFGAISIAAITGYALKHKNAQTPENSSRI